MQPSVEASMDLSMAVRSLYATYGQQKTMGVPAIDNSMPHFFLLRTFLGENDLLIIFNTKRCRYRCHFCQLPAKSSKLWISAPEVLSQAEYVITEVRHSLSILDRITLSNEGSILDVDTFPEEALREIFRSVNELRRVRTVVIETRLEFVDPTIIDQLKALAPRVQIDILTGFETHNPYIRDKVLHKRESLGAFLSGLDRVASAGASLTAYVLYKPAPDMSDEDAFLEAEQTIDFLKRETTSRGILLGVRINPMYRADNTKWSRVARATVSYQPPRLTDVMRLAERKASEGVNVYIGLSTEGLADDTGVYSSREDYSPHLIRPIKLFNDKKISHFDWSRSR